MATIEQPVAERRFEHLVLDFLAYLEFERGLSRNTLDAYRTDLLQFGRFLEEREVSALDAQPSDVADFLEALARGGPLGAGRSADEAATGGGASASTAPTEIAVLAMARVVPATTAKSLTEGLRVWSVIVPRSLR